MSRLQSLERQLLPPKKQESQPPSDLGSAIDAAIRQQVEQQVAEALDRHRDQPRSVRALFNAPPEKTDYRQIPPVQTTEPLKDLTVQIQRDELKRASVITVGKTTFAVQRDREGRMVRLVQES